MLYSTCTVYTNPLTLLLAYHSVIYLFSSSYTYSFISSNSTGLFVRLINASLNNKLTARRPAHLMEYVLIRLGLAAQGFERLKNQNPRLPIDVSVATCEESSFMAGH